METKVDTHVNSAGASASTPGSRQNSTTLEPSLLYITPPIDSSKYSITYKESQHPYRKYIIEEDLFDALPEPRAGQKHPVQSLANIKTSSAPHSPIETHPKPGERRVTSADLEKLVSTARSFAFLAATRLGHRKDEEFGLVPHQIVTRHGRGEEDEVIRMINFTRTENYRENYTLENCTKACRLAVMYMIRTLEGALERYDTDPDILWSLLMHQSISFAWDSEKCLDLLQASLTEEDKATLASKWSPEEASYYTATAKETYRRRLDKERKVMDHALTVQKVAKVIERVYGTTGATIAIQDGGSAGQSVPHVHTHIIPRKLNDFPSIDDVYTRLEGPDGNVGQFLEIQRQRKTVEEQKKELVVESMMRPPRTMEDMEEETKMLAAEMEKDETSRSSL
ncbi:hypothetical protein H072_4016 [Dactylellina haptotyla CBS 200.50]|uniref:HIT domain-containing protein n=1 Tax=Dactylellina haptotyla (strain CBS 200.50) TaxID=1284197 RepID=S8AFY6_DACHA|nr:hypothetical protein H072_4016 [Dactylellina haptotyla CBS 200.50]